MNDQVKHDSEERPEGLDTDPWDAVGSEFKTLGGQLRDTYRQVADENGPSEDDVRDAFATLARAWGQVAGAVGDALRDPDVRANLKSAVSSFATAIGTTISDLGNELRGDSPASNGPAPAEEE